MYADKFFRLFDRWLGIPLVYMLGLFRARKPGRKPGGDPSRILVIKLTAMEDILLASPVLRNLRRLYPDAMIDLLSSSSNAWYGSGCSHINEALHCNPGRFFYNPLYAARFLASLRKKGYQMTVDLDQCIKLSSLLGYACGADRRVGFDTDGQYKHFLSTDRIIHRRDVHEVECCLDLLRVLGIEPDSSALYFQPSPKDSASAGKILARFGITGERSFAVVSAGAAGSHWQRQWPAEKTAELCGRLAESTDCRLILARSEGEAADNRILSKILKKHPGKVFSVEGLSPGELAALLSLAKLFVSGDTGGMRLAEAVGTPVVALYGPTGAEMWGPLGKSSAAVVSRVPCSPCMRLGFEYGCRTRRCMEKIPVEDVLGHVLRILG